MIPFFPKGTERNEERGEIRVFTFSSFIYIYIYKGITSRHKITEPSTFLTYSTEYTLPGRKDVAGERMAGEVQPPPPHCHCLHPQPICHTVYSVIDFIPFYYSIELFGMLLL